MVRLLAASLLTIGSEENSAALVARYSNVARAGARCRLPLCSLAAPKQKSPTAGDRVATRLLVRAGEASLRRTDRGFSNETSDASGVA